MKRKKNKVRLLHAGKKRKKSSKKCARTFRSRAVKRGAKRRARITRPRAAKMGAKKRAGKKSARRVKFPSFKRLNPKQAEAVISGHLASRGHDPVLIGEACAYLYFGTILSPKSIEFAISNYSVGSVGATMKEIGFVQSGEHSFVNREFPIEVRLIPQPISLGDDIAGDYRILKTLKGPIKTLTPTDCVRHRLSQFFRFGDRAALLEAVRVTRKQKVDREFLRKWSQWEWAGDKFEEFLAELGAK